MGFTEREHPTDVSAGHVGLRGGCFICLPRSNNTTMDVSVSEDKDQTTSAETEHWVTARVRIHSTCLVGMN